MFPGLPFLIACRRLGRRPGCRPGGRAPFFRVAERKEPKKGRPYCARPFAALRATCDARSGGAPQNSLRAARSAQTTAASQCTKCVCPAAHARPPCPALLGTHRREPGGADIHTGHRVARPHLAGASATRCAAWAERSNGPNGCSAVPPLLAEPAAGRLWGGTRVGARVLRALTRRGCPSGARQRKASSTAHPATAPTQVCPFAQRRGRRLGVAFSLVTFFWRSKRKLLARRATPGSRTQHGHAVANAQEPRQAQPERMGREQNCKNNSCQRFLRKRPQPKNFNTSDSNRAEIRLTLVAKPTSACHAVHAADAPTYLQTALKSGRRFYRKIIQPATRSAPLPRRPDFSSC
jgi:hypothetical protein